ncbi:MAG TPA: type II secretion protein, partial [Nitrospirae bacterium]|nr:type II secretion protein [Nitrospirota bacterium]
ATGVGRYRLLADWGVIAEDKLREANDSAVARGLALETVLTRDYHVPRHALLKALSELYRCPYVEYDERLPIPPELISGLDGDRLSLSRWFPIIKDGDTAVIAVNDPCDRAVLSEIKEFIGAKKYEIRVALEDDIQWFIRDFLHTKPGYLIGTERTGLAFWRNTMAHWRTRLACYRNDLARARTNLAFLRWGLGTVALSDALMRAQKFHVPVYLYWGMMLTGFSLVIFGLFGYTKIRRARMSPPGQQTLVEVTSAVLNFLENYHFIENTGTVVHTKQTMLARLGDFLAGHCTILYPLPASRERTQLARERNVLAGQRTVAACYRTIYARARTGLAFIRTGVSFLGLALGLISYFGFSLLTIFDLMLIVGGVLFVVDGALWYLPVRKEQAETPRCPVPT